MDIKPIETQYKGYRFRSRLEARWAVFFDAVGIEWEYELEGYDLGSRGWYLPDFWLPQANFHAEVKSTWDAITDNERLKLNYFDSHDPKGFGLIYLIGAPSEWETEPGSVIPLGQSSTWHVLGRCGIGNPLRIKQAIIAARSARFEHGEKPYTEWDRLELALDTIANTPHLQESVIVVRGNTWEILR